MRNLVLPVIVIIIILQSCLTNKQADSSAIRTLNNLKNIVDTISRCKNEKWYLYGPDINTIEVPIDPKDLTKTRIDTTIVSVEEKRKLGFLKTNSAQYLKFIYDRRLNEAEEAFKNNMDKRMLRKLNRLKKKFDSVYKQQSQTEK